jgi:pimeloyl-ACP methyl ester carboxylesterase
MPVFSSDGVEIAYLDTASADPANPEMVSHKLPVLLIHGFASHLNMNWVSTSWVRTLTQAGHRVIAFDNRGHGASQKLYDIADYGAPLMAEDARRLLDHLGIARAHVMGYSMGARISAFLVLEHPQRVASVVFGGLGVNMVRGMASRGDSIAEALEAPSLADVTDPGGRVFRAFAEQTKSDLLALAACMRSAREPITIDAIAKIQRPVLVAVGTDDVVAGSGSELAALIPGARNFDIAGREHMKAVGDPTFKAAVVAFLADHDTSSS